MPVPHRYHRHRRPTNSLAGAALSSTSQSTPGTLVCLLQLAQLGLIAPLEDRGVRVSGAGQPPLLVRVRGPEIAWSIGSQPWPWSAIPWWLLSKMHDGEYRQIVRKIASMLAPVGLAHREDARRCQAEEAQAYQSEPHNPKRTSCVPESSLQA